MTGALSQQDSLRHHFHHLDPFPPVMPARFPSPILLIPFPLFSPYRELLIWLPRRTFSACLRRLGIKPLCTHVTDKLGMVDCIPRSAAGLTGGSDWSEGLNLGNNIQSNVYNVGNNIQSSIYTPASTATTASTAAAGSYCQQTCIQCSNGMLAGPGCDNCLCGVSSDYYRDGTAPDNCNQVCYYCRTSMMSGYECDSCSCGHWPAPLTHDPLENSWY